MYVAGLAGVTRRLRYVGDPALQPLFVIAAIGVAIIAVGILGLIMSIVVGVLRRDQLRVDGDPWDGRTLEWSTASPPPEYNFALTPAVRRLDAWRDMKDHGYERPSDGYRPIHMPRGTAAGIVISGLAALFGFAMIWYIWWLAAAAFAALLAVSIGHTFNRNRDYHIPADRVAATEAARA